MTHRPYASLTLLLAACSACGDDGGGTADAAPPDPCAPQMSFKGEYLDWDSGGAAGFLGIGFATFALRSDPSVMQVTPPNGRIELCIPAADGLADISPTSNSGYISGQIVINREVFSSQPVQSYRSLTMTRAQDFLFSPSLGHIYVHVVGDARTVTSGGSPTQMQTFASGAWSPGNTGNNIYLGNVALAADTMLTVSGGAVTGPMRVPLSAGQITYVTLIAQ